MRWRGRRTSRELWRGTSRVLEKGEDSEDLVEVRRREVLARWRSGEASEVKGRRWRGGEV